jgi:hypothetical protein
VTARQCFFCTRLYHLRSQHGIEQNLSSYNRINELFIKTDLETYDPDNVGRDHLEGS